MIPNERLNVTLNAVETGKKERDGPFFKNSAAVKQKIIEHAQVARVRDEDVQTVTTEGADELPAELDRIIEIHIKCDAGGRKCQNGHIWRSDAPLGDTKGVVNRFEPFERREASQVETGRSGSLQIRTPFRW